MYRNTLLNPILGEIDSNIGGLDNGMFVQAIKETFVFDAQVFGKSLGMQGILNLIYVVAMLSIVAIAIIYPKIYKRK